MDDHYQPDVDDNGVRNKSYTRNGIPLHLAPPEDEDPPKPSIAFLLMLTEGYSLPFNDDMESLEFYETVIRTYNKKLKKLGSAANWMQEKNPIMPG